MVVTENGPKLAKPNTTTVVMLRRKYEKMPFRLRCIQKMAVWNEKTSFSFEV
jgi:hypothetical protein